MPVITTRASAATITSLRLHVREELGDILGDTAPDSEQMRFTDTKIDRAIEFMLFKMYRTMNEEDAAVALQSVDVTYAADAETQALPTAPVDIASSPIHKVDHLETADFPRLLRRIDPQNLEREHDEYVWCLLDRSIAVRPVPTTALTLRVWYIGNPFTVIGGTPGTDQHPYPVAHEELIVLGAARRLMSRDDEWGTVHEMRYQEEWNDFEIQSSRHNGPQWPAQNRRYT